MFKIQILYVYIHGLDEIFEIYTLILFIYSFNFNFNFFFFVAYNSVEF